MPGGLVDQKHDPVPPFRASLLLLARRTTLEESLSHLSVAPSGHKDLFDGPFAQPIEMRVHPWNPSFTPLQPVGCEIKRAITIGSKALAAQIAEQEHVCERN
jgi:hypothetical protein